MLKSLIFSIVLLLIQMPLWAREVSGVVKSGDKKLSEVIITDGQHFAKTNEEGAFQFDVSDNADFIYIFTPSGYTADFESGTPAFYLPISDSTISYDFDLLPLPFNTQKYSLLAMADPQTQNMAQLARFNRESLPDLQQSVANYESKNINTVAIVLGDITWDDLNLYPEIKRGFAKLKIPVYPVIGNHDHDARCSDNYQSAALYRNYFGPTDYGYNLGQQHYIVLNDIVYKGNYGYDEDLTDQQLEWVKNYLTFIPKGSELVIAMHAPFKSTESGKMIHHGEQLLAICKDYKLKFISGHTHLNSNLEVSPNIIEHNIGAICGSWWTADFCRDGTPNGYQIFEVTPHLFRWFYKSVGKDPNYQLKVFDRGSVITHPNGVVAKIWNWDPKWSIEWFEDEKNMGRMSQISTYDPEYAKYLQQNSDKTQEKTEDYKRAVKSSFFFVAYPSSNASRVMVRATDLFGQQYEQEIQLHSIDVEAHRGGAGYMPENTISAMLNGLRLGSNTLEFDLHLSKDGKVIVCHDAHFNASFTNKPNGSVLNEEEARKLIFYQMNYQDIAQYDTGSKKYARFPDQTKIKTNIPLVTDLIDSVEHFTVENQLSPVYYNIEIKSDKMKERRKEVPDYKYFADKVMQVLLSKNLGDRLLMQCFDPRCLNYLHKKYPQTRLVYLVENRDRFEKNMARLNFIPEVYSPDADLVDQSLVDRCKAAGMKVIPWTVDDEATIHKMIDLSVDGLISNYPDRVLKITRGYTSKILAE